MIETFDADRALVDVRVKDLSRVLFSLGANRGNGLGDAAELARRAFGHDVGDLVSKSAVGVSDTDDAFASVTRAFLTTIGDEFIGAQIDPVRVGFVGTFATQSVAESASWVGNGRLKPITRTEWAGLTVAPTKSVATVVYPADAFQTPRPDLLTALTAGLRRAVANRLNATFASAAAATTDAPAGIAHGAVSVPSTGTTPDKIRVDVADMVDVFGDNGISMSRAYWIASERAAARLRLEQITDAGGATLAGRPLLSAAGASGLTLVSGQHVALAMGEQVAVSRTENATVEMSDAPDVDSGTVVSLFQKNLVALRAELFVGWTVFGPGDSSGYKGVVTLSSATWT